MDFDKDEDQTIVALKKEYGIKQTTELMRFLIKQSHREILKTTSQQFYSGSSR